MRRSAKGKRAGLRDVAEAAGVSVATASRVLSKPEMVTPDDLVLTRILWLDGIESRNANTFQRYIYIHGTNDERNIGRPASHGCVRLKNAAMMELYDLTPAGTGVWIEE